MARRAFAGIGVECTGGNDDRAAAAGEMGQRRAAATAKGGGETGGLWQIEAHDLGFAAGPAEGVRRDNGVGGLGAAGRLAAARAVALEKAGEGPAHLIGDSAAEAASGNNHEIHHPA